MTMATTHGDEFITAIALQYTGSALVNRVETYRRMPHWNSHSRDIIENIRRFYTNSLLDADKQTAINLFLGVEKERAIIHPPVRGGYQKWYHAENLEPCRTLEEATAALKEFAQQRSDFWVEYYRPLLFTSLGKHFAYSMNSTLKLPGKTVKDMNHSPFEPHGYRPPNRDPQSRQDHFGYTSRMLDLTVVQGVRRWMGSRPPSQQQNTAGKSTTRSEVQMPSREPHLDKNSTAAVAEAALNPKVSEEEEVEYQGYIDQCQELLDAPSTYGERKNLELYGSAVQTAKGGGLDLWPDEVPKEYIAYINRQSAGYTDIGKESYPVSFNYERWLDNF
ncbi:hypothetical protein D9613_003798 [Agrocybe pediades]|uniref:Uncharacterized protein n=1 Tax=Agrocybe pediades TaxID=84607 RepID=A0A8H4VJ43_9AGAR|nr:hypothetical protein D9613_003798 [Agrocybe pediades]